MRIYRFGIYFKRGLSPSDLNAYSRTEIGKKTDIRHRHEQKIKNKQEHV